MHRAHWLLAMGILWSGAARAETDRERAEREIQQQMKQLVKPAPPPSVRVIWEGVDSDKVALDDARFMLDDTRLSYGELENLAAAAAQHRALYDGPIDPGKHQLEIKLAVHRTKVSLFEGLRRTTYKVSSALGVPGQPGLQVTLRIKLHYDENQPDPKKRLRLETREEPHMVVAVDDAPIPEPPRTVIATAREVPADTEEPETKTAPEPADTPAKEPAHRRHEKRTHGGHRHGKVRLASSEPSAQVAPAAVFAKPHAEAATPPVAPVAPVDAGAFDDAGPSDAGAPDAGPADAGLLDAGATALAATDVDAGGATAAPARSGGGALWIALAGVALLGLAAFGLRRRGK